MTRVAWLTDIHLNFLESAEVERFWEQVAEGRPDAVLLGGDVAEAPSVVDYLAQMSNWLPCPVYFVLGNHDYYRGSIGKVRQQASALCESRANLHFLTGSGPFELSPSVGLVGDDGWADARLGDYERSLVMMYDYRLIDELSGMSKAQRWPVLRELGDAAARHVSEALPQALERYPQVWLLTHVPPFREACWYQGQISNDEWLPHFTCLAVGQAVLKIMREYPQRQLTIFCGHTHSSGECRPLDNVRVVTGQAEYGAPTVQQWLEAS